LHEFNTDRVPGLVRLSNPIEEKNTYNVKTIPVCNRCPENPHFY
jgi:hypothetical protein